MIGWNRKRNDRHNPDDHDGVGGELVPFPQRRTGRGPDDQSGTAPESVLPDDRDGPGP